MMNNYQKDLIALRKGTKAPKCSGDYWSPDNLHALEELFWTHPDPQRDEEQREPSGELRNCQHQ